MAKQEFGRSSPPSFCFLEPVQDFLCPRFLRIFGPPPFGPFGRAGVGKEQGLSMNRFIFFMLYAQRKRWKNRSANSPPDCIAGCGVSAVLSVRFSGEKLCKRRMILVFRPLRRATQGSALRIRDFLKKIE